MKKTGYWLLWIASAFIFGSCNSNNDDIVTNPFDNISENNSNEREKIIVISDLHIGSDLTYSENVKHLPRLEQFLNEVRSSATIRELVIAGDMFDDWYVPTRIDAYGGGSQADFVRKTVAANQGVFDILNGIIREGKIKLTYVPGNHDMGFTPENVNIAMPGVNQARDASNKYSVGTYYPDNYPEIAIEHGHRYDFFCSAAPNANETEAPGATVPPGYFFARIAANSFTDPTTIETATKVPAVKLNNAGDAEQYSKYIYYNLWKKVLDSVIYVKDNFSDPIIKTNVGNFTKTYAINDILPYNSITDGSITMNLYNGIFTQTNWDERQAYNSVPFPSQINKAIVGSLKTEFIDDQSNQQYFQNPDSKVRVVVFGHTHNPMIKSYTNLDGKTCLYANSGTWEDQKTRDKNAAIDQDKLKMDFVTITPVKPGRKLQVALYQYHGGQHLLKDSKEVDL